MENTGKIVLEKIYDARPERLWAAMTNVDEMRQWYFPMLENFRAEPGFETRFNVHHNGKDFPHHWKVTESIQPERIAYEWRFDGFDGLSLAEFNFIPMDGRTLARFNFEILEPFDTVNHPELSSENFRAGWHQLMESLENHIKKS